MSDVQPDTQTISAFAAVSCPIDIYSSAKIRPAEGEAPAWRESLLKLTGEHRQAFRLLQQEIDAGDLAVTGEASKCSRILRRAIINQMDW